MKILLMAFLVASNYFPSWQGGNVSKPYTKLNGVYIEWDSHINLDFVSYTVGGVNDCVNLAVEVTSGEDVYLYEYQFYDLSGEMMLPLEIDNYVGSIGVDVIISNFFYPDDLFEYEFELEFNDSLVIIDDKMLYANNPYFYNFGNSKYLYHRITFPYYKNVNYLDGNSYDYLEFFVFNVDDYFDVFFTLKLEYNDREYLIGLDWVKKDNVMKLYTVDNYYYNPILDILEIEQNDDNYYISRLNFPIKDNLKMELIVEGDINSILEMEVVPSVNIFGSCEEAKYCFVTK